MNKNNYNSSNIKVLKGLEPVRKRPGMYIGSTDKKGLHHLIWEIFDNSIDEALSGHAKSINIKLIDKNTISIEDDGRGIPVDQHESGVGTLELIFTTLHAGGKFESSAYKVSGGLHGVGSSVVNALSEFLKVEIKRDNFLYKQEFSKGEVKTKLSKEKITTNKTGTKITFKADKEIFKTIDFDEEIILERIKNSAYLINKLKINFESYSGIKKTYLFENGIIDYIKDININKNNISDIIYFSKKDKKIEAEVAMQFTNSDDEKFISFVNNINTKDGGSHDLGFKTGLTKIINSYAKNIKLLKDKEVLEGSDIRNGLSYIINLKLTEDILEFEGQTKSKLSTTIAKSFLENLVQTELNKIFLKNNNMAKEIINKALLEKKARIAAKKARIDTKTSKELSKNKDFIFGGKLTPALSKDKSKNELYIVEGDSAGGSAKQGRDKKYQAILPLRGKVINSEKSKLSDILKNEEIKTMISAINTGIGTEFDIEKCNYDKIIIMTDADQDGAHIQTLILSFFFRFMYDLIKEQKIYIAMPPLYKIEKNKKITYVWTDDELEKVTKDLENYSLQRYKGLGEMNAEQLWETTMDPDKRTLIQVKIDDDQLSETMLKTLMGDKTDIRKQWLEENINFD